MFAEIERFAGRPEADDYLRLRGWLTELYRTEFDGFIGANFDSPLSLLTPQLARLVALGGFRRWEKVVRRFLERRTAAAGVHLPGAVRGGSPAERAGGVRGDRLHGHRRRACTFRVAGCGRCPMRWPPPQPMPGSNSSTNQRYPSSSGAGRGSPRCVRQRGTGFAADAVVLTTELPDTYRLLGRTPRRLLQLRPAPSAVVAHVGCPAVDDRIGHHTIVFGDAWRETFRDIIDDGRVMGDPSLLVTRPTASDPSLAPPGRDLLYVLAPAPNTEVGQSGLGRHLVGLRRRDARSGHRAPAPTRRRRRSYCTW